MLTTLIQDVLRSDDFRSLPFFDHNKALAWLDQLPRLNGKDRNAAEPILMMLLTATLLQKSFQLSSY